MIFFDVAIIGGGPIGLACAVEASRAGLSYVVLEKGVLVNAIYHFPTNMTFFSTSALLEIGEVPFVSIHDKPQRQEALEYYRRVVEKYRLNLHLYEEVLEVHSSSNDKFEITTSRSQYLAQHVIVATGFYDQPNLLNIPGETLTKVSHYYRDAFPYYRQKLVIIGAGNSACDAALEAYYKGAEVTLVVRKDRLKDTIKYWIKPNIENRLKEGSIKAYFNSIVTAIRPEEIDLATPLGSLTLANDFVLALTGYHPNFDFLKRLGIELSQNVAHAPVCNMEDFESSRPNMYVAGVVCAGMETNKLFIENSRDHATKIIDHILRKRSSS